MSWRKILPNLVTIMALLAAFFSLVQSAHGEFVYAAQLIMLCLILDGLDGNLARVIKGSTKFGAELDTFVDMTAYGLAPAFLIHEVVMKDLGYGGVALVCLTVISGALRLSRFRVSDPFRGQRGYCGLPVTVNAGWVAMFILITQSEMFHADLSDGPLATFVWTCSVAFLFLQVSNVRYSKPTKTPLFFVMGIVSVMLLFGKMEIAVASAVAMCVYGFFFAFISPFLPKPVMAEEESSEEDPLPLSHS